MADSLNDKQKIILYRIAIRQDEQDRKSNLLPKTKMLESDIYKDLLDLGYLTYQEFGEGDEAIVNLIITLEGMRYCYDNIDEIAELDKNSRQQF